MDLFAYIPFGFLLLGGLVGGIGYFLLARVRASRSWPSSPGRIVRSELVWRERTGSSRSFGGLGSKPKDAAVAIEYEYTHEGRALRGTRVGFSDAFTKSRGLCERIVGRYPVGAAVEVFYDPARPEKATLERNAGCGPVIFLVVGGVFFALGAAMLVFRWV